MCGIAGLFSTGQSPTEEMLEAMNDPLAHRGPDDESYYVDGPVGLAHRRLSIIDLETGDQPVYNEDESVVVIYNGEIYNYESLRAELRRVGHRFTTDTDTEVLIHLYEEHGTEFVTRLDGMFAFALYDTEAERLVLARDPMGIKPLYFARDGDQFGFASELPALLASPLDHGGLDETAISEYFAFGYVPSPRSVFRNVEKLRPGEMVAIGPGGVERDCFYEPLITVNDPGIERASQDLRDLVRTAVDELLMSDVPLGAFLSGGIDSSVVVGTMAELSDDPIRTFTVGFEDSLFDETWAAETVAEFHGTDHTTYTVTPETVCELVPELLSRLGEPFADPSLLPTYIVARETRRDATVALSGDGADELFGGYGKYRGEYYSGYYRLIPEPVRRRFVEPVVSRLTASRESTAGELTRKLQKFTRGSASDVSDRHYGWVQTGEDTVTQSVTPSPRERGVERLEETHQEVAPYLPDQDGDDLTRIQAADVRQSLPDQLLQKVDLASMYNSLEVRVPFLDTDIVEYAFGLSTRYKIDARTRKRVMKRAFDDLLPEPILSRPKQGFDMPVGEWFKHELADEFRQTIRNIESPHLDTEAVMRVYRDHESGRRDHEKFLWAVYVFGQWHTRMRREGLL
jgi:asparagine synthase (glutamine-hydrolysing)